MTEKVPIRRLPSGVPGFDAVLGGGVPEFSFNLIAGAPGSGKTTLVQQMMFSMARPDRPALYFTVFGEPPLKMLRYQQQFGFFDLAKVNGSVRFVNLAREALIGGLDEVLQRIIKEVESTSPAIVVVDSFRSVMGKPLQQPNQLEVQQLVQELGIRLSGWEATTFLVGEFLLADMEDNPVFTVADGLVWLYQSVDRNSMVRKMQVMKMRGQGPIPGLHAFRITDDGVQVFPRLIGSERKRPLACGSDQTPHASSRLSVGVPRLDEMLGGGMPVGYSALVAGPSGSGKTVLSAHFINEGVRRDEPGVIAVFERRPSEYARTSNALLERNVQEGRVGIVQTRPLNLSIDETMYEITEAVHRLQARRLVIDSLSGLELALAPAFREDFRASLYHTISNLTSTGLTVLMTAELEDIYTDLRFSPHGLAFLTDVIILQRYADFAGQLKRLITVVKVRASAHSKDIRSYDVTADGLAIGHPVVGYEGLLTGSPRVAPRSRRLPAHRARRRPR